MLSHRICIADVYTSIADVSPMCCRCVWDIFNLGVHRRMFAYCSALFGDISSMVFGVQPLGENFNACIEIFLDIPMSWRSMAITRVHRRSFAEPLVHGGAGLAMPKFVHRESIMLRSHEGQVPTNADTGVPISVVNFTSHWKGECNTGTKTKADTTTQLATVVLRHNQLASLLKTQKR